MLIGVIIFQRACDKPIIKDRVVYKTTTIKTTDTLYKPVPHKVIKYVDRNINHYIIDTVIMTEIADTMAILQDYFAKVVYKDTIIDDSNAFITIYDTISQNRILSRSVHSKVFTHTYTKVTQKRVRNKVFVGFGANGWSDKFGMSADVALLTKREHLYTMGYDPINNSISLSLYWKLKFKK